MPLAILVPVPMIVWSLMAPITGTALVAIIYPFVIVPAEIRYGLFVELNRGSHRERRHWLLTSF